MAITQQIARLPTKLLRQCSESEVKLDKLISLDGGMANVHTDLGWSPYLLKLALDELGLEFLAFAIRLATEGSAPLNAAHPSGSSENQLFDDEIRYLEADEVRAVAKCLELSAQPEFSRASVTLCRLKRDGVEDPVGYLTQHYHALAEFYAAASKEGQSTVVWWN